MLIDVLSLDIIDKLCHSSSIINTSILTMHPTIFFFCFSAETNNLSGSISEDFCCMPCLQSISVAGNDLGGDLPSCISNMQAEIDVRDNNNQGSALEERTTSP